MQILDMRPQSKILEEYEAFAASGMTMLLPKIRETKEAIIKSYEAAGSPLGTGPEKAMRWFDGVYEEWQRFQESPVIKEARLFQDETMRELVAMGDWETHENSEPTVTPKGVARSLYMIAGNYVQQADIDGRGLNENEVQSLVLMLLVSLSGLAHNMGTP